MQIRHTLNIGILAHVDAGKTSLTERLLFDTGAIDALGSVEAGNTHTDTGVIERQRGITVRSAVASFAVGDTQVNLIDTPGHADFIAEVERALSVLDGAILVLSAVEGVQPQTRRLFRVLREMRLPVLIFVNKIDRAGARDEVVDDIRRQLSPQILAMTTVRDIGTPTAHVLPERFDDPDFAHRTAEQLADTDDAVLTRLLDGPGLTPAELNAALTDNVGQGLVHPVYFGSARTGRGVDTLIDGISSVLRPAPGAADAPPRGLVFAIERSRSGPKTAYLRLFSGTVRPRQRLTFHRREPTGAIVEYTGRVTALEVVGQSAITLTPGNIGTLTGLAEVRVGDVLGDLDERYASHFAAPTMHTLIHPQSASAATRLHRALQQLAEQDPLIHVRTEPTGGISLLLYGEIQQEIIAATLAQDFGIAVTFEACVPACLERPRGVGEAYAGMDRYSAAPGGFWATIGLRVEPAPHGNGVSFRYETELGALPHAFHCAVEESVYAALAHGPHGWPVTDCTVVLTHSGFAGPISTAGDFRGLTPIVLGNALARAGTQVYEPCHAFEVDVPADTLAAVVALLTGLTAEIANMTGGTTTWRITGALPARLVRTAEQQLPSLTHGDGMWWSKPSGDRVRTVAQT